LIGVVALTVLVFAFVAQAALLATDSWREREPATTPAARRVIDYTRITWEPRTAESPSILLRQRLSRFAWLDAQLQRLDLAQRLSADLRAAGMRIHAGEFLSIQLGATVLLSVMTFLALSSAVGGLIATAGGAAIGFVAPMFWLRKAIAARRKRFEDELPEALDLLTGSLRAGYSTPDAMEMVAREGSGPCAQEFAAVVQELNLGGDVAPALEHLVDRMPTEDARLLVAALAVQRRTGGNLIDVLKQLARTLRERKRLRDEVRVLTTGPRYSGYIGAALPYIMLAGTYLINRQSFDILMNEQVGHIAIAGSSLLVVLGLFLNNRIANIEV
jgi:tight adherence protein B